MPTKRVKLSAMDAVRAIVKKDGPTGLWRGIGPALILVINPIIQVSGASKVNTTEIIRTSY